MKINIKCAVFGREIKIYEKDQLGTQLSDTRTSMLYTYI